VFANWLITPKNPWFTRHVVNASGSGWLGRGIVHPADEPPSGQPARQPELLAFLEQEMIAAPVRHEAPLRLVLNSATYQLSFVARSNDPRAEANFAHYPLRRLEAEVLIDALCQITGHTEEYYQHHSGALHVHAETSARWLWPTPALPARFWRSSGARSRDTGLESDRNNRPTAAQRLHLLNSSHVRRKIDASPKLRALMQSSGAKRQEAVTELYLTILSRLPTDEELQIMKTAGRIAARPRLGVDQWPGVLLSALARSASEG